MKAVVITTAGGPEVLQLQQVNDPEIKDDEILIKVEATALNRADTFQRNGSYPPPKGASPYLGLECSGTIQAVGKDVSRWKVGDQVIQKIPLLASIFHVGLLKKGVIFTCMIRFFSFLVKLGLCYILWGWNFNGFCLLYYMQVCALLNGGGYAEKVAVHGGHVLPIPPGVSLKDAAGLPEVACTVWSTVFMMSRLSAGETFLVKLYIH